MEAFDVTKAHWASQEEKKQAKTDGEFFARLLAAGIFKGCFESKRTYRLGSELGNVFLAAFLDERDRLKEEKEKSNGGA